MGLHVVQSSTVEVKVFFVGRTGKMIESALVRNISIEKDRPFVQRRRSQCNEAEEVFTEHQCAV
jgi:hypothetical protein